MQQLGALTGKCRTRALCPVAPKTRKCQRALLKDEQQLDQHNCSVLGSKVGARCANVTAAEEKLSADASANCDNDLLQ
jgi:hypothetical protein